MRPLRAWRDRLLQAIEYLRVGSCGIRDDRAVPRFLDDDAHTVLVSFPRTGSHLVRMVLELYFERPLLPRSFYHPLGGDYLLHHTHDEQLDFVHPTVMYLCRDPVDTVFSELRYRGRSPQDPDAVREVAARYGRHLARWLLEENFTRRKTTVSYEEMVERPLPTLERLVTHFGEGLDEARGREAWERVTRDEVARKTRHDRKVVRGDREAYRAERARFRSARGERVWEEVSAVDGRLPGALEGLGVGPRDGS